MRTMVFVLACALVAGGGRADELHGRVAGAVASQGRGASVARGARDQERCRRDRPLLDGKLGDVPLARSRPRCLRGAGGARRFRGAGRAGCRRGLRGGHASRTGARRGELPRDGERRRRSAAGHARGLRAARDPGPGCRGGPGLEGGPVAAAQGWDRKRRRAARVAEPRPERVDRRSTGLRCVPESHGPRRLPRGLRRGGTRRGGQGALRRQESGRSRRHRQRGDAKARVRMARHADSRRRLLRPPEPLAHRRPRRRAAVRAGRLLASPLPALPRRGRAPFHRARELPPGEPGRRGVLDRHGLGPRRLGARIRTPGRPRLYPPGLRGRSLSVPADGRSPGRHRPREPALRGDRPGGAAGQRARTGLLHPGRPLDDGREAHVLTRETQGVLDGHAGRHAHGGRQGGGGRRWPDPRHRGLRAAVGCHERDGRIGIRAASHDPRGHGAHGRRSSASTRARSERGVALSTGARIDLARSEADANRADVALYEAYQATRALVGLGHAAGRQAPSDLAARRLGPGGAAWATHARVPEASERYLALRRMGTDWVGQPGTSSRAATPASTPRSASRAPASASTLASTRAVSPTTSPSTTRPAAPWCPAS